MLYINREVVMITKTKLSIHQKEQNNIAIQHLTPVSRNGHFNCL